MLGVDISEPMLAVARSRSPLPGGSIPAFRLADAQADDLGEAAFDGAFSRFGVMFFSDPVAAFANIRRGLKPGGRLAFVCWRPLAENPWMYVPVEAARPLLPPLPPSDPMAPGPFAFADATRIRAILTEAGFDPHRDHALRHAHRQRRDGRDLGNLSPRGPLGAALRENPGHAEAVLGVVREALAPYLTAEGVLMPAAVWIVSAAAN